jgi:hypothetical protein
MYYIDLNLIINNVNAANVMQAVNKNTFYLY